MRITIRLQAADMKLIFATGNKGKLREANAVLIPARDLAVQAGNAKCENVAILGALEPELGFGDDVWRDVIQGRVPQKTIEANCKAYELGAEFARSQK